MPRLTEIPASGPILTSDIYSLLGRKRAGEGYDTATPIQKGADGNGDSVNIWCRCKPMVPINDHPWPLTEAERSAVNYGIALYYNGVKYMTDNGSTVTSTLSFNQSQAITEIPKCEWRYDRRPGEGDWKRLTDWAGYTHIAAPPVSPPGDIVMDITDSSVTIGSGTLGFIPANNLRLTDFAYLADCYFCIIIYRERLSTKAKEVCGYATASATIGTVDSVGDPTTGSTDITLTRENLTFANASLYGTPQYVLCAATKPKPSFSSAATDAVFLPLPCDRPLVGSISLNRASPFTGRVYAVGSANSAVGMDSARFLPMQGTNEYFGAGNGMWLFCELTGRGTPATVQAANLTFLVRQTLASPHMFADPVSVPPAAIYTQQYKGGAYTQRTSITVPASGTVYAILDLGQMWRMDNTGAAVWDVAEYGTFFANLAIRSSSNSDFAGAMSINLNIHPGTGILIAQTGDDRPYEPET